MKVKKKMQAVGETQEDVEEVGVGGVDGCGPSRQLPTSIITTPRKWLALCPDQSR